MPGCHFPYEPLNLNSPLSDQRTVTSLLVMCSVSYLAPHTQHQQREQTENEQRGRIAHLTEPSTGPTSFWNSSVLNFFILNFGGPPSPISAPNTSGSGQMPS